MTDFPCFCTIQNALLFFIIISYDQLQYQAQIQECQRKYQHPVFQPSLLPNQGVHSNRDLLNKE